MINNGVHDINIDIGKDELPQLGEVLRTKSHDEILEQHLKNIQLGKILKITFYTHNDILKF